MVNLNDLIGKPFSNDGYGPDSYSCFGLGVEVSRRYGITIERTNISVCACKEVSQKKIQERLALNWQLTDLTENPPIAVLIRSGDARYADHIGVYIGKGRMIHIFKKTNVVVERISNWKHKIIGYYKYVNHTC